MLDYRNIGDRLQIRKIIKEICNEYPSSSNKELYSIIRTQCNIDKDNIYLIVKGVKDEQIDCDELEERDCEIDSLGNHEILFNGEKISFDINFVDLIFLYYSKHGYNLSGEQMQQEFGITAEDWIVFKRQFGLYKDSHVISDWSIDNLPKERLDVQLFRANNAHADRVRDKMIISHALLEKRELAKLRKSSVNGNFAFDKLQGYIDRYTPQTHHQRLISEGKTGSTEVICISDFHLGKNGTKDILERLDKVCENAIKSDCANIQLLILGDIVESLVPGGMHPGQEAGQEYVGFELWKLAVDSLVKLITNISLYKNVEVHCMAGNHGRVGVKNAGRSDWLGELSIYETVSRCTPDANVYIYNEYVEKIEIDGIQYVFSHGEYGFDKEAPEAICWKYKVNPEKPVVVVFGHLHNVKVSESMGVTKVGLPALAGAGEFDTMIRKFSAPGYVKFWNNEGKINLQVIRL